MKDYSFTLWKIHGHPSYLLWTLPNLHLLICPRESHTPFSSVSQSVPENPMPLSACLLLLVKDIQNRPKLKVPVHSGRASWRLKIHDGKYQCLQHRISICQSTLLYWFPSGGASQIGKGRAAAYMSFSLRERERIQFLHRVASLVYGL